MSELVSEEVRGERVRLHEEAPGFRPGARKEVSALNVSVSGEKGSVCRFNE